MNVKQWLELTDAAQRAKVAKAAGTTVAYFDQLAGDHRRASPALAKALVEASRKHTPHAVMTFTALRPDLAALMGAA